MPASKHTPNAILQATRQNPRRRRLSKLAWLATDGQKEQSRMKQRKQQGNVYLPKDMKRQWKGTRTILETTTKGRVVVDDGWSRESQCDSFTCKSSAVLKASPVTLWGNAQSQVRLCQVRWPWFGSIAKLDCSLIIWEKSLALDRASRNQVKKAQVLRKSAKWKASTLWVLRERQTKHLPERVVNRAESVISSLLIKYWPRPLLCATKTFYIEDDGQYWSSSWTFGWQWIKK